MSYQQKISLFLIFALFGCSHRSIGSPQFLAKTAREYNVPALGFLVSDRSKTQEIAVFGKRDFFANEEVKKGDKFSIGSNSKAMTATLISLLVKEGALSWNTTVSEIAPPGHRLNPKIAKVTLLQLLQHRSGLEANPPYDLWKKLWEMEENKIAGVTQRKFIASHYMEAGPKFPIGSFHYSNLGYTLIGYLLENKFGKSFEDLRQDRLFKALGMKNCQDGAGGPEHPKGHKTIDGERVAYFGENPRAYAPAGRVSCPLEEWGTFARFHLNQVINGEQSFHPLYNPPEGHHYAAGFMLTKGGHLRHEGNNTLNHAILNIDPKMAKIILIVANDGDDDKGVAGSHALLKILTQARGE